MKRWALLVAACSIGAAARGAAWSDLWLRQDQQAQALLDAGQAAAAAPLFSDAPRRAYAEIKAQQYEDAAKRLQGLQDPEAQYNRGNALARGGELQAALQAYESALKQAPRDTPLFRDALHNHELVAKQLKQQPQAGGQNGQDQDKVQSQDQRGDQNRSDDQTHGGGQKQSGDQKQSSDQNHSGDQDQRNDSAQSQSQARNGQSAQDQSSRDAPPKRAASKDDAASKDKVSQAQSAAGRDQQQAQSGSKDAAAAAEADARAAMQSAHDQTRAGARAIAGPDARSADAKGQTFAGADVKPESEQTLALEQWLRWIPDDPSGLLRRKFVIEHMMKQREAQP